VSTASRNDIKKGESIMVGGKRRTVIDVRWFGDNSIEVLCVDGDETKWFLAVPAHGDVNY